MQTAKHTVRMLKEEIKSLENAIELRKEKVKKSKERIKSLEASISEVKDPPEIKRNYLKLVEENKELVKQIAELRIEEKGREMKIPNLKRNANVEQELYERFLCDYENLMNINIIHV